MIKLFAWEERTAEKINEKRQAELKGIFKFKFALLFSANVKCVSQSLSMFPSHAIDIRTHSFVIPMLVMLFTFFTYVGLGFFWQCMQLLIDAC